MLHKFEKGNFHFLEKSKFVERLSPKKDMIGIAVVIILAKIIIWPELLPINNKTE